MSLMNILRRKSKNRIGMKFWYTTNALCILVNINNPLSQLAVCPISMEKDVLFSTKCQIVRKSIETLLPEPVLPQSTTTTNDGGLLMSDQPQPVGGNIMLKTY